MKRKAITQESTTVWHPCQKMLSIDAKEMKFIGNISLHIEDEHNGQPTHGTEPMYTTIFGMNRIEQNDVQFVASYSITEKHDCIRIEENRSISGCVEMQKIIDKKDFEIVLLAMESSTIEWKKNPSWVEDIPSDIRHFDGIGRIVGVPWEHVKPIPIHCFVRNSKLMYVVFFVDLVDYIDWVKFTRANIESKLYDNKKNE